MVGIMCSKLFAMNVACVQNFSQILILLLLYFLPLLASQKWRFFGNFHRSSLGKKTFRCYSDSIVGKIFKLGIKENIYRIMKDFLVSLFLSVVGRAPFDGVKERWTF